MASTSAAHACASRLESLWAERAEVMTNVKQLGQDQQQQATPENKKTLERLQQKEQSLLDLISKLQEKENLLLGSSAGAAADAAAAEEACVQATIKRRCPCSSKYAAHLEWHGPDNQVVREAATVVDPEHIVTFAHKPHDAWRLGQQHQVSLHSGDADRRRLVTAQVALTNSMTDIVILKIPDKVPAPILDAAMSPGDRFYLHGQSTQAHADSSSISHGVIAATELDDLSHIRGDMPSGYGDSGGGCFSVDTGKLIAINVGRDNEAHKAVLVPSAVIQHMLAHLKGPHAGHT